MKRPGRPLSPFLSWPDFYSSRPFSLPTMVHGLEASQWWDVETLAAGQHEQLRLLLEWSVNNVPYYTRAAGYGEALRRLRRRPEGFASEWEQLPILTKSELRALGPQLNARSLPVGHEPLAQTRTSGSTGIPVTVNTTTLSRTVWDALTIREHLWQKRDFSKRLGVIRFRKPGDRCAGGQDVPSWGHPVSTMFSTGAASVIHIGEPVDQIADWLKRFAPNYLLTYPSVASSLVETMGEQRPASLEEIRLMSEPVDAELETALQSVWKVRCSDMYSANELGHIAFRCAEHGQLHIQAESVLVEILADDGRRCDIGETGRVVLTPLHNLATPLIRYEIGDYATVGAPCACGRGLPVIAGVRGRVRNMVQDPDGRRFWPVGMGKIRSIAPIRQAQYVQTALSSIELRLVLDRPLTDMEVVQTQAIVQQVLGYPFEVTIVGVDDIERGPTGKFEEFRSLLTGWSTALQGTP